jgi:hypothetical protein
MNGRGHGGHCERVPSGEPMDEKLAVRLGQCPNCAAAICTRCKTMVKPEAMLSHSALADRHLPAAHHSSSLTRKRGLRSSLLAVCAEVTAETDPATLALMAKIGKKCPACASALDVHQSQMSAAQSHRLCGTFAFRLAQVRQVCREDGWL